jgi:hypothetical protein
VRSKSSLNRTHWPRFSGTRAASKIYFSWTNSRAPRNGTRIRMMETRLVLPLLHPEGNLRKHPHRPTPHRKQVSLFVFVTSE